MKFAKAKIYFGNMTTSDGPIILSSLPFPFEVQINYLPTYEEYHKAAYMMKSKTGMSLSLKRSNMGHLNSGYYYPTTAFALLSMISYLINPEVVSNLHNFILFLKFCVTYKFSFIFKTIARFLEEWE